MANEPAAAPAPKVNPLDALLNRTNLLLAACGVLFTMLSTAVSYTWGLEGRLSSLEFTVKQNTRDLESARTLGVDVANYKLENERAQSEIREQLAEINANVRALLASRGIALNRERGSSLQDNNATSR
jgi:hypothetical protein